MNDTVELLLELVLHDGGDGGDDGPHSVYAEHGRDTRKIFKDLSIHLFI